jgi:hypothetical protein
MLVGTGQPWQDNYHGTFIPTLLMLQLTWNYVLSVLLVVGRAGARVNPGPYACETNALSLSYTAPYDIYRFTERTGI